MVNKPPGKKRFINLPCFLTILELPRPFRIPLGLRISNQLIAVATTAIAIATATTTTITTTTTTTVRITTTKKKITAFEIHRKTVD